MPDSDQNKDEFDPAEMQDAQCSQILSALDILNNIGRGQLGEHIFRHSEDAVTRDIFYRLTRLKISLEHYTSKTDELYYIGCIGHFSTGKSSTINSLLNPKESEGRRKTDLNPTDTGISLITHPQNIQKLAPMERHGEIEVKIIPLELDFLTRLVLIDTPGAGEPHRDEMLVRDFLPVCDRFLYFFSATNALDNADIPVLEQIFNKLDFIPIQFAITRADEFRQNYDAPLSQKNFQEQHYDTFLSKLLARVNEVVPEGAAAKGNIKRDSFNLIDNRALFGIDDLKNTIEDYFNNPNRFARLHTNKVFYFRKEANFCLEQLQAFITEKLEKWDAVSATALENVTNYSEAVTAANEQSEGNWINIKNNIQERYQKYKTENKPEAAPTSSDLLNNTEIRKHIERANDQIQQAVRWTANDWKKQVQAPINDTRRGVINTLRDSIQELDSMEMPNRVVLGIEINQPKTWKTLHSITITSHGLNTSIDAISAQARTTANNANESIQTHITSLRQRLTNLQLRDAVGKNIEEAKAALESDVEVFLSNVDTFVNSVLTMRQNDLIKQLGIGQQLDEKVIPFSIDGKQKKKTEICSELLEPIDQINREIQNALSQIHSSLLTQNGYDIPPEKISILENIDFPKQLNIELENGNVVHFFERVLKDENSALDTLFNSLNETFSSARAAYDQALLDFEEQARGRIWKWTGLGAIIGLGITGAASLISKTQSWQILDTMGANIATGIVATILVSLSARWWSQNRETERKLKMVSEASALSGAKKKAMRLVNDYRGCGDLTEIADKEISEDISQKLNKKYDESLKQMKVSTTGQCYQRIVEVKQLLLAAEEDYRTAYNAYFDSLIEFFDDHDSYREHMMQKSEEIRSEAIEAPFSVLKDTKDNLIALEAELENVKFG